MVLIPPDERSIDNFELVLHNPVAIDYFYEYLEEMELNEQIENQGAHEYLRSGGGSVATIA